MIPTVTRIIASGNYTTPLGCKYIVVYAAGGGGGGGGGGSNFGSGGGASSVYMRYFLPGTYAVVIGTGGAGGALNTDGSNGTNTSFGTMSVGAGSLGDTVTVPLQGGASLFTPGAHIILNSNPGQAGGSASIRGAGSGGTNFLSGQQQSAGYISFSSAANQNGFNGGTQGGGGGAGGAGTTTAVGGAGSFGIVRVEEYY